MWIIINCGKLLKNGNTRQSYLSPEKLECRSRSNNQNPVWNNRLVQKGDWLRKEYEKAVYCHPVYLTYIQSTSNKVMAWDDSQSGIKSSGENINNLQDADDTTLMVESKEELKNLLMRMKDESENVGLKFNFQKTKIVASVPITSWQIEGEN